MCAARAFTPTAGALWWEQTRTIYAIGRNYVAHAHELGNKPPKAPFWFIKPWSSMVASGSPHQCAPGRTETHHELELGVVIGSLAKRVAPDEAMQHVAGYCLALDMTDREGQNQAKSEGKPWAQCKGWDTSCPVSDFIPAERVADPAALHMWLKVNGEEEPRQHGTTANMIFSVPQLISALSHTHTLHPGDLILTGTPEGVGPVAPGDVIAAGITELGVEITVPIVAAGE
jgi:acylpyruvate hydrolase